MKWPFARRPASPAPPSVGAATTRAPMSEPIAPPRRDWAALPAMQVAGERPISLTAKTDAFIDTLATRQVLVQSPRLEHIRHVEAPSGSFRGVLTPATPDHPTMPQLHEPSALPSIEHRRAAAAAMDDGPQFGSAAVEQLLAIGELSVAPQLDVRPEVVTADEADDRPDGPLSSPRGRIGLADSRRRGLGPAYHGAL